jgi:hypothetical protein
VVKKSATKIDLSKRNCTRKRFKEKTMTLTEMAALVLELDPNTRAWTHNFKLALILLSATEVGPDLDKIVEFTGLDYDWVKPRFERLEANGVFKGDKIHCNWFEAGGGDVAFWLDVAVAEGFTQRVQA